MVAMFGIKKKDQTKVWQKILGLSVGDKVKATKEFYYFSPRLRRYASRIVRTKLISGEIKKGTIGTVIQVSNPANPTDKRIYRVAFPLVPIWCTDAHLVLIVNEK